MNAIFWLIPLTVILLAVFIWLFFWAVDNGQYDDFDTPAKRILFDDDLEETQKHERNE